MTVKEKVEAVLSENKGHFLSGEALAEKLGVSRTAVWKAVETLRTEGRRIEALTRQGYRLSGEDDGLTEECVRAALTGEAKKYRVRTYKQVTSTNTLLRAAAEEGEAEGLCIIAESQTAGKGRRGRSFCSPDKTGLYMSILLRPELAPAEAIRITTAAAVAVCWAMEKLFSVKAEIKWVNDIFINGKKVCGILTEAAFGMETSRLDYAVLGIGVNLVAPEGGFPEEIRDIAGALTDKYRPGLRAIAAAEILNAFAPIYENLTAPAIAQEYRERSLAIGKSVTVLSPAGSYPAEVLDVDDACGLKIRRKDGTEAVLSSGEISILLPKAEKPRKKMRIGFFIDTFYPMIDGVVTVVDNYARRLAEIADVTVFAPESREKDYKDDFPYRVVRCKCLDLSLLDYTLPIPALDPEFVDDLLHEQLDIVHVHSPFTVGTMGILYGRMHRIPVVATMHSQYRQDFKRAVRLDGLSDILVKEIIAKYELCDECWAVNGAVARIFHEQYGFSRLPKVQDNATDMAPVADKAAARREIGELYHIPEDAAVFLFVGRINKLKNILFLADALREYKKYEKPFRMLFVGEGQDMEELKEKIAADGLSDSVSLCGRISDREALAKHYAAADLFLFPSLYDASSLVQIEAACQHVPTVFLRGAATADTVTDGVNGFLAPQDPAAFAGVISHALEPQVLSAASGAAYRDLYKSFDQVVRDIYGRYEKLIEEKKHTRTLPDLLEKLK